MTATINYHLLNYTLIEALHFIPNMLLVVFITIDTQFVFEFLIIAIVADTVITIAIAPFAFINHIF